LKTILIFGTIIVNLALISYSIAIINEQRKKIINPMILRFLTIGVILDISATCCMIIGSSRPWYAIHGLLGYSSLILMLTDTILVWKFKIINDYNINVPKKLHLYSRIAYIWWVIAFITGALMVILR
jgi:hypothetical protein